jgi:hypothetical protein
MENNDTVRDMKQIHDDLVAHLETLSPAAQRKFERKHNQAIRAQLKRVKVFQYELAKKLQISEPTLSALLRNELPPELTAKLLSEIDQLAIEKWRPDADCGGF